MIVRYSSFDSYELYGTPRSMANVFVQSIGIPHDHHTHSAARRFHRGCYTPSSMIKFKTWSSYLGGEDITGAEGGSMYSAVSYIRLGDLQTTHALKRVQRLRARSCFAAIFNPLARSPVFESISFSSCHLALFSRPVGRLPLTFHTRPFGQPRRSSGGFSKRLPTYRPF